MLIHVVLLVHVTATVNAPGTALISVLVAREPAIRCAILHARMVVRRVVVDATVAVSTIPAQQLVLDAVALVPVHVVLLARMDARRDAVVLVVVVLVVEQVVHHLVVQVVREVANQDVPDAEVVGRVVRADAVAPAPVVAPDHVLEGVVVPARVHAREVAPDVAHHAPDHATEAVFRDALEHARQAA